MPSCSPACCFPPARSATDSAADPCCSPGLVIFGGGALVATQLSDPGTLIAVRAVMGLGAAMIMPTTLSIITGTFSNEARDRAVGIWAGVAGGSALVGLLASGLLLEWFHWSSVFGLNAALAAVGGAMTLRFVPRSTPQSAPLDPVGALLSALGLGGLVWGFIEGPARGWTRRRCSRASPAESRSSPRSRSGSSAARSRCSTHACSGCACGFSAGSLSVFVQFFAMFGMIFVVLQYLQFVFRYSPLEAGAALAPTALLMVALAPRVPRLVERVGVRPVGPVCLVLIAAGFRRRAARARAGARPRPSTST